MTSLKGVASAEGTARFAARSIAARHAVPEHFRRTSSGLTVSSLGLGTYIGRPDAPTDSAVEQAVQISLTSGRVNVVDTAINYRHQRAERSIGRALARLSESHRVARDEIFLATKAGYFAPDGESRLPADEWVEQELVRPGVLDPADVVDGCHAMSASYLTDQFARSRRNLGVDAVDLLYLHNAADAQLPVVGPDEFRRRLADAFSTLEQFRTEGTLVSYGLATWDCLRVASEAPVYLSLQETVQLAEEVGGTRHGFRFIQFPFSWAMPEAATRRNQRVRDERCTLFDAARRLGIGCFTSVPLVQGQLARGGPTREALTAAQTAIQFARSAPETLAPLVGQKEPAHLSENLALAERPPWDAATFAKLLS